MSDQRERILLRPARPEDAAAVAAVNNLGWKRAYRGVIADDVLDQIALDDKIELFREAAAEAPQWFVVAVQGDSVVGFVIADPDPPGEPAQVGEIQAVYVHPDHWGGGAGSALLACGQRLLADAGCTVGILSTLRDVTPTRRFYAARGWEPDGTTDTRCFTRGEARADAEMVRLRRPLGREPDLTANRRVWDQQAAWYAERADQAWAEAADPTWGMYQIPDRDLGALPELRDKTVVELGCGTAYVSAWCLAAGATHVTGIDNSPAQLETARRLGRAHDAALSLVHGDAAVLPFADATFDVAISEYGASIWCDPHRWIPEAARVLRDDGVLVFLANSVLRVLTYGDYEGDMGGTTLRRAQRDMHRFTWPDDDGVEFHVSHGDQIRILRRAGFDVVDLIEVYCPPDASTRYHYGDAEWGSRWPPEEIWVARRRAR